MKTGIIFDMKKKWNLDHGGGQGELTALLSHNPHFDTLFSRMRWERE